VTFQDSEPYRTTGISDHDKIKKNQEKILNLAAMVTVFSSTLSDPCEREADDGNETGTAANTKTPTNVKLLKRRHCLVGIIIITLNVNLYKYSALSFEEPLMC